MGQCSSTPSSEELGAGGAVAAKAFLNLTRPVPIVGQVADVLLEVKDKYEELSGVSDEAENVAAWAIRENQKFMALKLSLNKRSASNVLNEILREEVKEAARCIDSLLSEAKKINGARGCCAGSEPARLLKSEMFKAQFEAAQNAVEQARTELKDTLLMKIGITVEEIKEQLDAMSAKLDTITNVNERQLQRGLVESVRQELTLLPVAKKIVDGDGAGGFAALDAFSAEVRESAAAKYVEGMALYQQKKWSEAIVALNDCVELDQENSKAWFALGLAYWELNGRKNCEAEFVPYTKCIEFDPNHAVARNNLGLLYEERKDYKNAEDMYREAIKRDQTYAAPWWNLSALREEQKHDIPGAIEAVEEFINRYGDPSFISIIEAEARLAKLYIQLGHEKAKRKDYAGAKRMFRKAIDIDPDNGIDLEASKRLDFGDVLTNCGDIIDGKWGPMEMYLKVLKLNSSNAETCWNLSIFLINQKHDIPGAIEAVEEYISRGGDRAKADEALARLYCFLGQQQINRKDYKDAEEMFRNVIKLDPSNAWAYWNLSLVLLEPPNGDILGAIEAIENFIRHGGDQHPFCVASTCRLPTDASKPEAKIAKLYARLGQLKARREDHKGAKEMYQTAIKWDPTNGGFFNNLGAVMEDQEEYEKAENMYREAIARGHCPAHRNLSIFLEFQKNDIPGAIKAINEYINCGGDRAKAERDLARLRAKCPRTRGQTILMLVGDGDGSSPGILIDRNRLFRGNDTV